MKQGWGSFHSPPAAPGVVREVVIPAGVEWLAFGQGTDAISKRQIYCVFDNVHCTQVREPLLLGFAEGP